MNTEQKLIAIIAIAGGAGLLLGILMMFITKSYLNRLKRRKRYIELIWGTNNEWYNGEKFDFFMANYLVASSTFTAWWMRNGLLTAKLMRKGSYIFPMLHKDDNYIKLLHEFPFFVRWEFTKVIIIILSFAIIAVGMAREDGWW